MQGRVAVSWSFMAVDFRLPTRWVFNRLAAPDKYDVRIHVEFNKSRKKRAVRRPALPSV